MTFFVIVLFVLIVLGVNCIKVVPEATEYVVERLGAFDCVWGVGLHFKIPFIQKVAKKVSTREHVCDFPPQNVITKDNVSVGVNTIVYLMVTDSQLYTYGVQNPINAVENLTATILRNIVGGLELDETLTSRDTINTDIRTELDMATDKWGIKITRVELKDIIPPQDIRDSMEKQMKAERERREAILQAEGKKKSAILTAEGETQSAILRAEAEKQAAILGADAEKERLIREAEGKAEALRVVAEAKAAGLKMLKEAGADDTVLTLKSLEALESMANGRATKIIVPSNLQGIASLATTFAECTGRVKEDKGTPVEEPELHEDNLESETTDDFDWNLED